ncbi:MAG: hypothetical protein EAZ53_05230 [Bacteroidetes bacterium]|nr:MAG: hypothetical protein EAZ53_05230 [Bacteroidota bacterium]
MKHLYIISLAFLISFGLFAEVRKDIKKHLKDGNITLLESYFEDKAVYEDFINYFKEQSQTQISKNAETNKFYSSYHIVPYKFISESNDKYILQSAQKNKTFTISFSYQTNSKGKEYISSFKVTRSSINQRSLRTSSANSTQNTATLEYIKLPFLDIKNNVVYPESFLTIADAYKSGLEKELPKRSDAIEFHQIDFTPLQIKLKWCKKILFSNVCGTEVKNVDVGLVISAKDVPGNEDSLVVPYFGEIADITAFSEPFNADYTQFANYLLTSVVVDKRMKQIFFLREGLIPWKYGNGAGEYTFSKPIAVKYVNGYIYVLDAGDYYNQPDIKVMKVFHTTDGNFSVEKIGIINTANYPNIVFNKPTDITGYKNFTISSDAAFLMFSDKNGLVKVSIGADGMPLLNVNTTTYLYATNPYNSEIDYQLANIVRLDAYDDGTTVALSDNFRIMAFFNQYNNNQTEKIQLSHISFVADTFSLSNLAYMQMEEKWYLTDFTGKLHMLDKFGAYISNGGKGGIKEGEEEFYEPMAITPNPISDATNPYRYRFIVANKWTYETGFKLLAPDLTIPKLNVFENTQDGLLSVAFATSGKWDAVEFATGITMQNVVINGTTISGENWNTQIIPGVPGALGNELLDNPNIFTLNPFQIPAFKKGWNELKVILTVFRTGYDANNNPIRNLSVSNTVKFFWIPTQIVPPINPTTNIDDYSLINSFGLVFKVVLGVTPLPCYIYKNVIVEDKTVFNASNYGIYILKDKSIEVKKGGTLINQSSSNGFSNYGFEKNGFIKINNEGNICTNSSQQVGFGSLPAIGKNLILEPNYFYGINSSLPITSPTCKSLCDVLALSKIRVNTTEVVTISSNNLIDVIVDPTGTSYNNAMKYEVTEVDFNTEQAIGSLSTYISNDLIYNKINLRTALGINFKACSKYKITVSVGCNTNAIGVIEWFNPTSKIISTRPTIILPSKTDYCDRPRPITLTGFGPLPENGFRTNSALGTAFWSGTNISRAGVISVNATLPRNTPILYTYRYTDLLGCSNFATTTITVQSIPSAPIIPNIRVCENDPIVFTVTGNFTDSYKYTDLDNSQYSTFNKYRTIPNAQLNLDGVYSVTGFLRGCESNVRRVTVTVNSLPGLNIGLPLEVCLRTPRFVLTAQPNGGTFTGVGVQKVGNRYFFTASVAGFGVHTIVYTYQHPSTKCVNSISKTITVGPIITLAVAEKVCANDAPFFPAVVSPLGGLWSKSGVPLEANLFTPTGANIGLHLLTYNFTSPSGCVNSASKTITVVGLPASPVATNSGEVCENNRLGLFATNIAGATYQWSHANGYVSTIQNATILGIKLNQAGEYTVKALKDGCFSATTASAITLVTVNSLPIIEIVTTAGLCFNGTALDLSQLPTPTGGTWTGTGVNSTSFEPNLTNVGINKIGYTYIDSKGCQATKTTLITVLPSPVVNIITTTPNTICATNFTSAYLVADPTGNSYIGPFAFQWAKNGIAIGTATGQSFTTSEAGLYTVSATGLCGVASKDFDLTIDNGSVLAGAITISGNNLTCPNSRNVYTLPFANGAKYNWKVNGNATIEKSNTNSCTILGLSYGNFKIEAYQILDCITFTSTLVGSINTSTLVSPTITSAVNSAVCSYEAPFKIEALPPGGVWSGSGISTDGTFTPSPLLPKLNTIAYTFDNTCEQKSASITLEVNTGPSVNKEWTNEFDIPFYISNYSIDFDLENNLYILSSGGGYRYFNCVLNTFAVTKIGTNGIQKWQNIYNPANLQLGCGINVGTSGEKFVGSQILSDNSSGTYVLGNKTVGTNTTNMLFKYDLETGTSLWTINLNASYCENTAMYKDINGDLYVSCPNANLITKISKTGTVLFTITDIINPSIKTDVLGNLYVAGEIGTPNNIVNKYSATGTLLSSSVYNFAVPLIEVDNKGNLYIAENTGADVLVTKKNAAGVVLYTQTLANANTSELKVDKQGNLYSKSSTGGLTKLDANGNQVWTNTALPLGSVWIIDNFGNIYVTNGQTLTRIDATDGNTRWNLPITLSVPNFPGLPNKTLWFNNASLKADNFSNIYTLGNYFDVNVYYSGNNFATKYSQCGSSPYNNSRKEITFDKEKNESIVSNNSIEVFPNPFSAKTTIEVSVETENALVSLLLTDLLGRKTAFSYNGLLQKGKHTIYIDGNKLDLATGIYLLSGSINEKNVHVKLIKE